MFTFGIGVVAGIAFVLFVRWWRRRRSVRVASIVDTRADERAGPRDRAQEALIAAFRTEDKPEPEDARREDQRILADALRDIARRRDADAAILWVLDEETGGVAQPVASSADDARSSLTPASLPVITEGDRGVIEWVARERLPSLDAASGSTRFVAAPLDANGMPGALSLHFPDGAASSRAEIREWIADHASMMSRWYTLVRTRSDVSRQNYRLRGLIRSAGTLQASRDPLELERTLVADALPVVGAEWAVLIRWHPEASDGEVRAATAAGMTLGVGFDSLRVPVESIAGQVCLEGRPQVFADARAFARREDAIFGAGARLGAVGSLLAVPLARSEGERPIGALVCGHREVAALRAMEARNAKNLGVIAAGALETAWAVEDARRNARTDALTGLANRRGFDERFGQVVQETDRYGGAAALVLLDIDHFKKVNDTYGHEAGDVVLVAVAQAIADGRRTVDLSARLGGEELAVLLPQTDAGGGREVAERLRKRIEALRVPTGAGEVKVTASFGVAEYLSRAGDSAAVYDRADQALYAAKRGGRNRVDVAT
jgi:diguanylate cyclase (GGDEF)-like protein